MFEDGGIILVAGNIDFFFPSIPFPVSLDTEVVTVIAEDDEPEETKETGETFAKGA